MPTERISLSFVDQPAPTAGLATRIWIAFAAWRLRLQHREALASFDDRMLRDLGITRADVWRELHRTVRSASRS